MNDLVVIARNPAEMQVAQQELVGWAVNKMEMALQELTEAEESLVAAKKNKWRVAGFQNQVRRARQRFEYYEKLKAAMDAGYVIIPNFDIDIFAIRTNRTDPKPALLTTTRRLAPSDFEQLSEAPKLGQGVYVDPFPSVVRETGKRTKPDGTEYSVHLTRPDEFLEVDFPFKLAKPQILTDTAKALALKIFDRVGVMPHRSARKGDPMVIGQVAIKRGPYSHRIVSFLITWWVAEADLAL